MKTRPETIKELLGKAGWRASRIGLTRFIVLLLLSVTTTVQTGAWEREKPRFCIDFCKGGIGEVCVQGWAYDPYAKDKEMQIVVVAATQPNDSYAGYEPVSTDDGYEDLIQRYSVEGLNTTYNVSGNHGFRLQLPIYAHLFEGNELLMYVKIYARTFEYNPDNPNHNNYQFLLYETKDPVKVVSNTGDGTKENPYVIYNAKHWDAVADVFNEADLNPLYADKYFMLNNEDGYKYDDPSPVTKMFGTSIRPFAGVFDGKGRTVNVTLSGTTHVAPFAFTEGATIKNLTVTGSISASQSAGGIVGDGGSTRLNLENCVCGTTISGFTNYAGGLMGWTEEDMTLNIRNCLFKGSFSPGSGGKYHPIACKNASKTVTGNIIRAFYLNTASPSAGLSSSNIMPRAKGFPVSATKDETFDEPVVLADGKTYYATHFTGQRLDYGFSFTNTTTDNVDAQGWSTVDCPYNLYDAFYFADAQNNNPQYLISPEFDGHDAISCSFLYNLNVASYPTLQEYTYTGKFVVGYSYTTKDIDAFNWEDDTISVSRYPRTYWEQYQKDFPGGVKYIAIKVLFSWTTLIVKDFNFKACHYPTPSNISVSKQVEQKATLTWVAPDMVEAITDYSYQYKKASEGSWSDEFHTTKLYADLSGLTPNTEYNFQVKANYDSGSSNWAPVNFTSVVPLPYVYGFDNPTNGWSMVDGWKMVDCNTDFQATAEDQGHTGIRTYAKRSHDCGFCFNGVSFFNPQYLISPRLPDNTPITVSFYYKDRMPEANQNEIFKVGYSTTRNDINAFTWVEEVSCNRVDWTKYEKTFPEGTRYIAVAYISQIKGLYIDDFTFEAYSSKPKPNNLVVSNLTNESATLGWEAPAASVTGYAYQYKLASEAVWLDEAATTAKSVTLSGLAPNTTYDFRIKAVYPGGEASNHVTQRFVTEGPVLTTLPFTEGFENGMGGWRIAKGNITTKITTSANNVHSGNCSFRFYPDKKTSEQYLISPQLDVQGAFKVSFYYKDLQNYQALFQVGYSTTTNDPYEFHWYRRCETNADWQEYTAYCPEGTKYFAIRWFFGYFLYLDDFTFEPSEAPKDPEQLEAKDITATSANLSWTGNAEKFELKYR